MEISKIKLRLTEKSPNAMDNQAELFELFQLNPFEVQLIKRTCEDNRKSIKDYFRLAALAYAIHFNSQRNEFSEEMIRTIEAIR